ncbi:MAG: class I SAM-dependent methyltransferase [Pseudorhodoplanes sp.]
MAKKTKKRASTKRASNTRKAKPQPRVPKLDFAPWYEGKTFKTDWTSWHFPNWVKWLAPYQKRELNVLEIGSWEGRSALFFLNYLPRCKLTCIDTFEGGQEHKAADDAESELPKIERHFDANTAAFTSRIEKIKAPSSEALAGLGVANRRFDIAYIDGGHRAFEVYSDGMLTWPLMRKGALVIFDDYEWEMMPERLDNPKPGIDAFLKSVKGEFRNVHRKYQIAVEKV